LTFYLDTEAEQANTITISNGSTGLTDISLIQDHVLLRADNGVNPIRIEDLVDYDSDEDEPNMLFDSEQMVGTETLAATVFDSGNASFISAAKVDDDSVVIAYEDADDGSDGKIAVVNIVTGAVELAPTTYETGNPREISATMVDADSIVISYRDANVGGSPGTFVVYNVLTGLEELAATVFHSTVVWDTVTVSFAVACQIPLRSRPPVSTVTFPFGLNVSPALI